MVLPVATSCLLDRSIRATLVGSWEAEMNTNFCSGSNWNEFTYPHESIIAVLQ